MNRLPLQLQFTYKSDRTKLVETSERKDITLSSSTFILTKVSKSYYEL